MAIEVKQRLLFQEKRWTLLQYVASRIRSVATMAKTLRVAHAAKCFLYPATRKTAASGKGLAVFFSLRKQVSAKSRMLLIPAVAGFISTTNRFFSFFWRQIHQLRC